MEIPRSLFPTNGRIPSFVVAQPRLETKLLIEGLVLGVAVGENGKGKMCFFRCFAEIYN
jgi:hypothetical protein